MWDRIEAHERQIGRAAWVMAWVGLVVGQLHALARFATEDGQEDLELWATAAWAEPAAELLHPLLGWADPDVVYVHYGKIWLPVFAAFTAMALVTYRRRRPRGFETWVWRVTIGGYVLATLGVLVEYWTQWTGTYEGDGIEAALFSAGWVLILPGFLLVMLGSTVLGITLLSRGFRPVVPAALLAALIPCAMVILEVTSMGSATLPVMFAFGLLGRHVAAGGTVAPARTRAERRGELSRV